jgi:NTP pyrophosphatase (non-canonical NTP hydrolase)
MNVVRVEEFFMDSQTKIDDIKKEALSFRDERNWRQYHDPKNLAMALSIETAELQELFLWKSHDEMKQFLSSKKDKVRIREELADIFIYLLYLSDSVGIDLSDATLDKIKINRKRYPLDKSYSSNKKYTDLD